MCGGESSIQKCLNEYHLPLLHVHLCTCEQVLAGALRNAMCPGRGNAMPLVLTQTDGTDPTPTLRIFRIQYPQGSDHGFFDTVGEDGDNFSDELEGTGGGSEEGYLEHSSQPRHSPPPLNGARPS